MVFVHGELWRAAAVNGRNIPKGARVRVKKVAGLTLEVEPVEAAASRSPDQIFVIPAEEALRGDKRCWKFRAIGLGDRGRHFSVLVF